VDAHGQVVDEDAVLGHLTTAVESLPAMRTLFANTPDLTVAKAKGFLRTKFGDVNETTKLMVLLQLVCFTPNPGETAAERNARFEALLTEVTSRFEGGSVSFADLAK
jgi:hypothetical protein